MSNPSQTGTLHGPITSVTYGVVSQAVVSFCQNVSQLSRRNSLALVVMYIQALQLISLNLNLHTSPWLSEKYFPDIRRFIHFGLPFWTQSSRTLLVTLFIGSALVCLLFLFMIFNVYNKEFISILRFPLLLKHLIYFFRIIQLPYASVLLLTLGCTSIEPLFHPWTSTDGCWNLPAMSLRILAGLMLVLVLFQSYIFDCVSRDTNLISKFLFTQNHVTFSFFHVFLLQLSVLAVYYLLPHRPVLFLTCYSVAPVLLYIYCWIRIPFVHLKAYRYFGCFCGLWFSMSLSNIVFNILQLFNLSPPGIIVTMFYVLPALIISPLFAYLLTRSYTNTMALIFPESLLTKSEQKYFGKNTGSSDSSDSEANDDDERKASDVVVPVPHWIHAFRYTTFIRPLGKRQNIEKARRILEFYSNRFPNSVDLFLQRAAFDVYCVQDHLGANVILSHLKNMGSDISCDEKFRMFIIEMEIDNLRRRQSTGMRDSDQYVLLQRSVKDAQEKLKDYLLSVFQFWKYLKKANVQIEVLPKITEDIKNRKTSVETVYIRLIQSHPDSADVMRSYATFCSDVLGDEDLSAAYVERADLLSAPSTNDNASSSIRSASIGGSVVGGKTRSRRKKSRLQAMQAEWITMSKAEDTSSIGGFSKGITLCFIVILACAFLSLISTEMSLNSVSNRMLVLVESSHISFQSALLPLSLRQLVYAKLAGTDISSLQNLAIETSQHLNYHFSRVSLGESYKSDVYQCPRVGTRRISAIDDDDVMSLMTLPRIFVQLFKNTNPVSTESKIVNLWSLALSMTQATVSFSRKAGHELDYIDENDPNYRFVIDNTVVSSEAWSDFWESLLSSSDMFFFNNIVIILFLSVISFLICIYTTVVFIVSRLEKLSQEKLGVLNLFLHLDDKSIDQILQQSKFEAIFADSKGKQENPWESTFPSSVDVLEEVVDNDNNAGLLNSLPRKKSFYSLIMVLLLLFCLILFIGAVAIYQPHQGLSSVLIEYSNFYDSFESIIHNLLSSFRSSVGFILTGDYLLYDKYRCEIDPETYFFNLNEIAEVVPHQNFKTLEYFEHKRSSVTRVLSIAAFLTSHSFNLERLLVPEFKPITFHYNFSSESDHELLKIKHPDIASLWYSNPQFDLSLPTADQQQLARHLVTSSYFTTLKEEAVSPLKTTAQELHSFFYSRIYYHHGIHQLLAVILLLLTGIAILLGLVFFIVLKTILKSRVKFLFGFISSIVIALSIRNGQNIYQTYNYGNDINMHLHLFQNDSQNALMLPSAVLEVEINFVAFLISQKQIFLDEFLVSYVNVDTMISEVLFDNDFATFTRSFIEEYLTTRKVMAYLTAKRLQSKLIDHPLFKTFPFLIMGYWMFIT
ncbi:hypothetical protein GEMRC1_008487 [Eukaryota sp. GEM-RC1]